MSIFDKEINRKKTGSLKWDLHAELAPYWVADMDFMSPDCVLDALHSRIDHGVFGYALPPEGFCDVLVSYMKQSHGVDVDKSWIIHMGGCVPALSLCAMAYCKPGDAVMTCGPVYPPIRSVHSLAGASLIEVPHVFADGRWTFDWEAMERAVTPETGMYILCNPQNPLGRVFSREELLKLADFCERHDLVLCSDEIHCDLVLDGHAKHVTALSLPGEYLERVVVMTAPSKTYNIAGIGYSMVMIPSRKLRERFAAVQNHLQPPVHCMAYASAYAAYCHGESWRSELVDYLRGNRDALYSFVGQEMPGIRMTPMEATYLAWMDCSALGLDNPQQFFIEKAGVFLNSGETFGSSQHVRFNFGTSRANVLEGLAKMAAALNGLNAPGQGDK